MSADIVEKTHVYAEESLALRVLAKKEVRSKSNLMRSLIVQYLESNIERLPDDVRASLVRVWAD